MNLISTALAQGLTGVGAPSGTSSGGLIPTIQIIINGALVLIGIVALVVLLIGGVQYIISAGNTDMTDKAKNTILYAIVGLIVIGIAAAIVNFVLNIIPG